MIVNYLRSRPILAAAICVTFVAAGLCLCLADPALAGYCKSLSDCVQNSPVDGGLMLTAGGTVAGVVGSTGLDSLAPVPAPPPPQAGFDTKGFDMQ